MFGIFWDCDGTIMDTEKSYAYAWKDFLLSKGLDLPIEDFDKFVGVDDRICLLYTSPSPRDRG